MLPFFTSVSFAENSTPVVPMTCATINEDNPFLEQFETEIQSGSDFMSVYEEIKNSYHDQVNEKLNTEIEKFVSGLSNDSTEMCQPFQGYEKTHPLVLSIEIRTLLGQYECALLEYVKNPPLPYTRSFQIEAVNTLQSISIELQTEILKSYKALDAAMHAYSEMRMWYPVHRDLQCLISQLEIYRDALRGFVDQITRLPAKFYNYGSKYQYSQ